MQESDYTILQELGKMGFLSAPPDSLSRLTTDHLLHICTHFLKINQVFLPQLQRYRLVSKITQEFNRLTNFGMTINHLLHFNPNETRKILITILSFESNDQQPLQMQHKSSRRVQIKAWLQQQYVHHHLRLKRRPVFDLIDVPNLQDSQIFNSGNKLQSKNLLSRLSESLSLIQQQGKENDVEFATKSKSKHLNYSKCQSHQISLISQNINFTNSPVTRDEIQTQTTETPQSEQQDLLESLSNHIDQLSAKLKKEQSLLQQQNAERGQIELILKQEEDKLAHLKQSIKQTKQAAQHQKVKLQALQDPAALKQQIGKLQKQLKEIKSIGQQHIQSLKAQILQLRQSKQQRVNYFKTMKVKSRAFEKEYFELVEKLQEKQSLNEQVEVGEGGVPRIVYTRRIAELQTKWRQSRKQLQQIALSLKRLHGQNEQKEKTLNKLTAELQNILNLQKKADDNLFQIKQLYKFYKETSQSILACLKNSLDSKREANDLQFRIAEIKYKDLQSSINRIDFMLQDLRNQKVQ